MSIQKTVDTVSERRVRLYQQRQGAAKVISSILTTVGAVEAISQGTAVRGMLTIIAGMSLEKEENDPGRTTCLAGLAVLVPAVFKAFYYERDVARTSTEAFILALKAACVFMLLRLLFMGRRLRQLNKLQQPKEVD